MHVYKVKDVSSHEGYYLKGKVRILVDPLLGIGVNNFTLQHVTLEPGKTSTSHHHSWEQLYFFLKGEAVVTVGEEEHKVDANTFVVIPSGIVHCLRILGKTPTEWLEFSVPPINLDYMRERLGKRG